MEYISILDRYITQNTNVAN